MAQGEAVHPPSPQWFTSADGARSMKSVFRRQGSSNDTPVLSNGAIIGIAIGGGAVLFAILIFIVVKCVKINQKRRRKTFRKLDLADDDDDIAPDMGVVAPAEFQRRNGSSYPQFMSGAGNPGMDWRSQNGATGTNSSQEAANLPPPNAPFAFHITGLRDSWPLVSWSKSPMLPLTENNELAVLPSSTNTRPTHTPVIPSTMERPTYPQLVHVRAGRYEVPPVAGQKRRSNPSLKSSVTKRPSVDRKGTPDKNLASILRSTSQRLKDAQRRPMSRVMSILSQASGQPPSEKAPSPPKDQSGEDRRGLVENDDTEYAESVKSSVLDMFARTPSPVKMVPRSAGSGSVKVLTKSSSPFDEEDDSLIAEGTPDLIIPAALTSPSKRGARSEQRHRMRISSSEAATKIHEDSRTSMVAFGGRDIFAPGRSSGENDPFTSSSPTVPTVENTLSNDNQLSIHQRRPSLKQDPSLEQPGALMSPLRSVSGNQRSPTKPTWAKRSASSSSQNPFLWSPEILKLDTASPTKTQRMGSTRRGHKRSQIVRVSDSQRPQSVSVVHEEAEDESKPSDIPTVAVVHEEEELENSTPAHALPTHVSSSRLEPSPTSVYSKTFSTRPPSVATFEPFMPLPNTQGEADQSLNTPAAQSSRASYSATLSMYDYYSSPDENTSPEDVEHSELPSRASSRSPSQKKDRRRGRSFSLLSSSAVENSLTSFPPPHISPSPSPGLSPPSQEPSPPASPKSTPMNFTRYGISNLPSTAPPVVSRLHGPRAPPRAVPRDSLQHSVGMLRRMNSEASSYSAAGTAVSEGSPTLPSLRGGGISPQKSYRRGSSNYLALGQHVQRSSANSSPIKERELRSDRLRDIAEMERAQAAGRSLILSDDLPTPDQDFYDAVTPNGEGESANALGLKMPVLSRPPSSVLGLPSPTLSPVKDDSRWSDVMAKPVVKSVARVSEMKMPSPRTPPKAGWQAELTAKEPDTRSSGLYDERGFLKSSPERRYDQQGFLKSSPARAGMSEVEGGMI